MIARTAKNIYNEQISKQILSSNSTLSPTSVNAWTIDFLNVLLGNSADHFKFRDILVKQTARYFKFSETELSQFDIRPTALYFSFLDLTNLVEKSLSNCNRNIRQ